MGSGLGTLLLGSNARMVPGTTRLRQALQGQFWRRLPTISRRKAAMAIASVEPFGITPRVRPAEPYIVVGMLRHTCGIGVGARLCYEALVASGAEVYGIDITTGIGQKETLPEYEFRDGSGLVGCGTLIVHINAHMMREVLQFVGPPVVADKHVIGYWAWELSRVPENWREGANWCHQVWATSAFTARAIRPILYPGQPLHVVHHPVAMSDKGAIARRDHKTFTVLSILDMASSPERKNPIGVVRAFKQAFGDDQGARLLLKVGSPAVSPRQFKLIQNEIAEAPNIICLTDYLSEAGIRDLYAQSDVYITLPRSEGFGLTLVEAMLAGRPVVASAWSGQADFLTSKNSVPVGHTLIPSNDENGVYRIAGAKWADPSIQDAATALRRLRDDPEKAKAIGAAARAYALNHFSSDTYLSSVATSLVREWKQEPPEQAIISELITAPEIAPSPPERSPVDPRGAVYIGDNQALVRTVHGLKLYVDTRDCSLTPHILMDGQWEAWITSVVLKLVKPGMRVLEVGANLGWFTTLLARAVGPSGSLTAYEANPEMADIARRNLMINGLGSHAKVIQEAVLDRSGRVSFKMLQRYRGSSSLFVDEAFAASLNDTWVTIDVAATTLDEIMPDGVVDLIKIDAEGAEPLILLGARELIKRSPGVAVIIEYAPDMIKRSMPLDDFFAEIEGMGFQVEAIEHDASLRRVSREEMRLLSHCDVLLRRCGAADDMKQITIASSVTEKSNAVA